MRVLICIAAFLPVTVSAFSAEMTAEQKAKGLAAADRYSTCIKEWMPKLARSPDAVELVADAVMSECSYQLNQYAIALKPMFDRLSMAEVRLTTLAGQKKFIITELVKLRADASSAAQLPEPKTREGKIAQCDVLAAEWRQWAAERESGVRMDMIEEHAAADEACRKEAEKLPLAADR